LEIEKKLDELEFLAKMLEKGELSLEETVTVYANGMKLAMECRKQLEETKLEVEEVTK